MIVPWKPLCRSTGEHVSQTEHASTDSVRLLISGRSTFSSGNPLARPESLQSAHDKPSHRWPNVNFHNPHWSSWGSSPPSASQSLLRRGRLGGRTQFVGTPRQQFDGSTLQLLWHLPPSPSYLRQQWCYRGASAGWQMPRPRPSLSVSAGRSSGPVPDHFPVGHATPCPCPLFPSPLVHSPQGTMLPATV